MVHSQFEYFDPDAIESEHDVPYGITTSRQMAWSGSADNKMDAIRGSSRSGSGEKIVRRGHNNPSRALEKGGCSDRPQQQNKLTAVEVYEDEEVYLGQLNQIDRNRIHPQRSEPPQSSGPIGSRHPYGRTAIFQEISPPVYIDDDLDVPSGPGLLQYEAPPSGPGLLQGYFNQRDYIPSGPGLLQYEAPPPGPGLLQGFFNQRDHVPSGPGLLQYETPPPGPGLLQGYFNHRDFD